MSTNVTLASLIGPLVAGETIEREQWPAELGQPQHWGLVADSQGLRLAYPVAACNEAEIRQSVGRPTRNWLRHLEVHPSIDSTSDRLLELARTASVDGVVCLAEVQTRGRGRRGRNWVTPIGGSLALSAGFAVRRRLADLGGLSLAIGLALLDALQALGATSLGLKWPNDLLLAGVKVGGILVELKNADDAGSAQAIVGAGINLRLPSQVRALIDQEVTDLAVALPGPMDRNALAARVLDSLLDYVVAFEELGFAPMRAAYDAHHWMHGKDCQVSLASEIVKGRVLGVTDDGELELETVSGRRLFRAGEVSLRHL